MEQASGDEMGTSPMSQWQELAASKLHCRVAGIKMKPGYRAGEAPDLLLKNIACSLSNLPQPHCFLIKQY